MSSPASDVSAAPHRYYHNHFHHNNNRHPGYQNGDFDLEEEEDEEEEEEERGGGGGGGPLRYEEDDESSRPFHPVNAATTRPPPPSRPPPPTGPAFADWIPGLPETANRTPPTDGVSNNASAPAGRPAAATAANSNFDRDRFAPAHRPFYHPRTSSLLFHPNSHIVHNNAFAAGATNSGPALTPAPVPVPALSSALTKTQQVIPNARPSHNSPHHQYQHHQYQHHQYQHHQQLHHHNHHHQQQQQQQQQQHHHHHHHSHHHHHVINNHADPHQQLRPHDRDELFLNQSNDSLYDQRGLSTFASAPAPPRASPPLPSRAPTSLSLSPPQVNSRFAPQARSNSAAGISEASRSRARWSISSHVPPRRQSIDSVALGAQLAAQYHSLASAARASVESPPRKLQKHRPGPSPSPGPTRVRRNSPSPAPVPPLASLPPIVTLPPLEADLPTPRAASANEAHPPRRDSLLINSKDILGRRLPFQPNRTTSGIIDHYNNYSARGDEHQLNDLDEYPDHDDDEDDEDDDNEGEEGYDDDDDDGQLTPHVTQINNNTMMYAERSLSAVPQQQPPPPHLRGHTRSRSHADGSNDTTTSRSSRDRSVKQPSQKAMLSRALEKANSAVQLDNSRNFEGARVAYSEACDLLHQVLVRTNGEEDRKKLEAISKTYTTRIKELDDILPRDKSIPPRRPSRGLNDGLFGVNGDTDDESTTAMSSASSSLPKTTSSSSHRRDLSGSRPPTKLGSASGLANQYSPKSTTYQPLSRKLSNASDLGVPRPMNEQYMPPPLSPRRPPSPTRQTRGTSPDAPFRNDFSMPTTRLAPAPLPENNAAAYARGHSRGNSHESVSWLDPIDESGASNAPSSSNHSRSSSMGVRRKHIRAPSGATEAEFDAALDDAIEAAYDDGYEIIDEGGPLEKGEDVVARALRRVELAKERVRESEREAMQLASDREKRLREQLQKEDEAEGGDDFYDANDSDEEEERLLEEMTKGYVIEDFSFGPGVSQARQNGAGPRASESGESTNRPASNAPTASTSMTSVSDAATLVSGVDRSKPPQAPWPPPTQALPQLPLQRPGSSGSRLSEVKGKESVRNRRLSGQNPKQLKIETSRNPTVLTGPNTSGTMYFAETPPIVQTPQPPLPKTAGYIAQQRQALSAGTRQKQAPSPTPPIPTTSVEGDGAARQPTLRKNFSSSSLRSMSQRGRNLSVAGMDEASDLSPGTPVSGQFMTASRLPAVPNLPTPIAAAFKDRISSGGAGGMYLFDGAVNDGHLSPIGSPTSAAGVGGMPDAPYPLEPCPTGTMLRPFWLMRCLFQTLAHPRGGHLSNKLFVPRDVWKVKGVKLKNVEDKISNCDLLTAALQKLSRVDTCDADATLEEMQSLEGIFEQVQANLTRRLGNGEVGVQSMSALFRDAANAGGSAGLDADSAGLVPRSGSVSAKSSFSWRRLRPKNSTPGLNPVPGGIRKDSPAGLMLDSAMGGGGGGANGAGGSASLPMTSHPTSKPNKRDLSAVQFTGPNANYMASLARLFDAAQAVDQIARQVEDPGLRHADKTQVGLELCTRHAAEFFAFYICRFVLTDLTILLDKFVKRGSEWVLV